MWGQVNRRGSCVLGTGQMLVRRLAQSLSPIERPCGDRSTVAEKYLTCPLFPLSGYTPVEGWKLGVTFL
jgi:hypothetical protein